MTSANRHIGSDFDDYLAAKGVLEEIESAAIKEVIAWQVEQLMRKEGLSRTEMAMKMNTSRSSLSRLLDPNNESVTLQTLERAAAVLGKRLRVEFV